MAAVGLAAAVAYGAPGDTVAEWDFGRPDVMTGKYALKLRGNAKIEDGRLAILTNDMAKPDGAAAVKIFPELTPPAAFTVEATFALDGKYERARSMNAMLWDSKYVILPGDGEKDRPRHTGFMLFLRPGGKDQYTPAAAFGYGDKSAQVYGKAVTIAPDVEHTLGMTFSATGKVTFMLDGAPAGSATVPAGSVAPAKAAVVLGDRIGSNYWPLGGRLRKIVLKEAEFAPVALAPDPDRRRVFERGETEPKVFVRLSNAGTTPLNGVTVEAELDGKKLPERQFDCLAAGSEAALEYAVEPWLLPGDYRLNLTATDAAGKILAQSTTGITIVPAYGDFMPVILWGGADRKVVKDLGFTHQAVNTVPASGDYKPEMTPEKIAALDDTLRAGLYGYSSIYAKYRFLTGKRFLRVDRDGKPYARENLEASNPEAQAEFAKAVADTAKALGDHPAWDAALLNSEVRDSSNPSFGQVEPANFRKFAGYDIPASITGKYPASYKNTAGFPWDRVIRDNTPDLVFLRWFWKEGDGWNPMHTLLSETLHQYIKHHFFTFYDPVVRVPPVWGSGGNADVVSQWTYVYPDPIKIGQATDEVIAMAQGNPGQKVMSMTQAIWYRSQTAPKEVKVANPPEWLAREPEAQFVTIAPDALREALWSKISRRLDGIMYHGSGSLIGPEKHSYRYTNPDSKLVLRELAGTVIKPLGPVLTKVPERTPEIGILESFTGNLYAPQHFSMGWSSRWAADLHLALQWAHFQPVVFYEEHLVDGKLEAPPKVLFIPGAEVLTDKTLAKLRELQNRGTILVGDEFTTPALMVDYRLQAVKRTTADPEASKQALQKLGTEIAAVLMPYYQSPMTASNPDLVVRRRGSDQADYVFVVNDKRTFGDYLGQWKMVMEKGLPNSGTVTVAHHSAKAYDLVKHQEIPLRSGDGKSSFEVALGPGDGTLVLLLDHPIAKVETRIPALKRGQSYALTARILDDRGQPVAAILPVEVTLTAADGRVLPGSGFYAARDGVLTVDEVAAPNMAPGKVTVKVRDLASGLAAEAETTAE